MSVTTSMQRSETRQAAAPAAKAPGMAKPMADESKLRAMTEKLAYDLYERRGCVSGHDLEDWLAAEKAARAELCC